MVAKGYSAFCRCLIGAGWELFLASALFTSCLARYSTAYALRAYLFNAFVQILSVLKGSPCRSLRVSAIMMNFHVMRCRSICPLGKSCPSPIANNLYSASLLCSFGCNSSKRFHIFPTVLHGVKCIKDSNSLPQHLHRGFGASLLILLEKNALRPHQPCVRPRKPRIESFCRCGEHSRSIARPTRTTSVSLLRAAFRFGL